MFDGFNELRIYFIKNQKDPVIGNVLSFRIGTLAKDVPPNFIQGLNQNTIPLGRL